MNHRTTAEFWEHFRSLPDDIQRRARNAFRLMLENERHPSLRLKRIRGTQWSVRITDDFRALADEEGGDLLWYWIGPHSDYDGMVGGFGE